MVLLHSLGKWLGVEYRYINQQIVKILFKSGILGFIVLEYEFEEVEPFKLNTVVHNVLIVIIRFKETNASFNQVFENLNIVNSNTISERVIIVYSIDKFLQNLIT